MGVPGSGRRPSPITPLNLGAARVLEYCLDMDLWHTDVARSLGVDPGNFRRVLTGERTITLAMAVAIEDMMSIPPRAWTEEIVNPPVMVQE